MRLWLFAALLVFTAGPARGLPDDSAQPIRIRTDEAIRDETTRETLYRGNVEMTQGSLLIRADAVSLRERAGGGSRGDSLDPLAGSRILSIEARGEPAFMQQQLTAESEPVQARARTIEYFQPRSLIRLTKAVRMRQGAMTLRAARVDYLIDEQLVRAFGNPETGQRVSTSIPPERLPAGTGRSPGQP